MIVSRAPPSVNKPGGCSLRRSKPKGPLKGCEETCLVFEVCVELSRQEKAAEERIARELERLDRLDAGGA